MMWFGTEKQSKSSESLEHHQPPVHPLGSKGGNVSNGNPKSVKQSCKVIEIKMKVLFLVRAVSGAFSSGSSKSIFSLHRLKPEHFELAMPFLKTYKTAKATKKFPTAFFKYMRMHAQGILERSWN